MVVVFKKNVEDAKLSNFAKWIKSNGLDTVKMQGEHNIVMGITGDTSKLDIEIVKSLEYVETAFRISEPYQKVSRNFQKEDSIVKVGSIPFGGGNFQVIAGPCSVESEKQIVDIAIACKKAGATLLRGGAFKPRTSPYTFQGLGKEGIEFLKTAKKETGLPIVSEIIGKEYIDEYQDIDVLQVGARNMQNFDLLKELGKIDKPILLKRGMGSTIDEWLMSAEYIMNEGNKNIILCERGIKTFEPSTRNTLDLSAIPVLKQKTHLPVIVDPSHASGISSIVKPLSLASVAAGCDGLLLEVHNDPSHALSDGAQSLKPEDLEDIINVVNKIIKVIK